jgi:uncharacterized membrane protein (UPF0136 family)
MAAWGLNMELIVTSVVIHEDGIAVSHPKVRRPLPLMLTDP